MAGPLTGLHSFPTGRSSDGLQEVQLPLLLRALCQLLYGHTYIQPDMLCAGNLRNVNCVQGMSHPGAGTRAWTFRCSPALSGTLGCPRWPVPCGAQEMSPCGHQLGGRPQGGLYADRKQALVSTQWTPVLVRPQGSASAWGPCLHPVSACKMVQ